jgi:ribose transport system substrate-binding protein
MKVTNITTGTSADSVASAFDSVVSGGYDGVFVPAIDTSLWKRGLADLNKAHIPVVTSGIIGLTAEQAPYRGSSEIGLALSGKWLADWVVAKNGAKANVVFYNTPELSFAALLEKSFDAQMKVLCPDCVVRSASVPVADFGSKGPTDVTDDLQANPSTTTAVFATGEQAIGLAQAMKTANLTTQTLLYSPDPSTLEDIQKGNFTAGLGVDLPILTWTAVDSLARLTTGQSVDKGAAADELVRQFLDSSNLKGVNISNGWTGYPDFATRFATLWNAAK